MAIRILRVWLGNETNNHAIWSPIIEKIDTSLARWERTCPSIEGRKTIIQWTIRGCTQYLTKAQGMPNEIKTILTKKMKSFAWDGEGNPTIHMATLESPISRGEKGLLNLVNRNKAIKLTWLTGLLSPKASHPAWACNPGASCEATPSCHPITQDKLF